MHFLQMPPFHATSIVVTPTGSENGTGAVVAGLLIGILESFGTGYISSEYKDAIALGVLLAVLLVRPSGLLGSSEAARLKEL